MIGAQDTASDVESSIAAGRGTLAQGQCLLPPEANWSIFWGERGNGFAGQVVGPQCKGDSIDNTE